MRIIWHCLASSFNCTKLQLHKHSTYLRLNFGILPIFASQFLISNFDTQFTLCAVVCTFLMFSCVYWLHWSTKKWQQQFQLAGQILFFSFFSRPTWCNLRKNVVTFFWCNESPTISLASVFLGDLGLGYSNGFLMPGSKITTQFFDKMENNTTAVWTLCVRLPCFTYHAQQIAQSRIFLFSRNIDLVLFMRSCGQVYVAY